MISIVKFTWCLIVGHRIQPVWIRRPEAITNPNSGMNECLRCGRVESPYGWVKL